MTFNTPQPQTNQLLQPIGGSIPNPNDITSGAKPTGLDAYHMNQFGLDDSHLGEANANGVRPVTDQGYAQLQKSIQESLKNPDMFGGNMPQQDGIPQVQKGEIGKALDSAGNTETKGLVGGLLSFL